MKTITVTTKCQATLTEEWKLVLNDDDAEAFMANAITRKGGHMSLDEAIDLADEVDCRNTGSDNEEDRTIEALFNEKGEKIS